MKSACFTTTYKFENGREQKGIRSQQITNKFRKKTVLTCFFASLLSCGMALGQTGNLIPAKVSDNGIGVRTSSDVDLLCDNQLKSYYQAPSNSVSIIYEYAVPVEVNSYTLTSANVNQVNDPIQWVLKASANGKSWVKLDARNKHQFYSRFHSDQFELTRPVKYKYFMLELKSPAKTKVALAEIAFSSEKSLQTNWKNFVYPEVHFVDKDPTVNGSKIYNRLIQNPSLFIRDHAQKVASILYWTDQDKRMDIRTLNYELRPDKGISAKGGEPPLIEIFYSADWVEKTALNKGDFDVLYETRGVLYHELTHGYQYCPKGCGEYKTGDQYWAFIEGLADAVRFQAGFFPITNRRPGGTWMDGYQTTGFFLQWLTTKDLDFLRKFNRSAIEIDPWSFDAAMKQILGNDKTTDGLWKEYQDYLKSYEADRKKKDGLVDFVNPLMGTDSKGSLSNGNTYPAIAMPWGMNFWMPQTGKMGDGWAYTYASDKIRGFKQTHQPSPWINDYGQFSIMPMTGDLKINEDDRASWFSHKSEKATPYYYSVYLSEYDVVTEITPTERCAYFRFTFPQKDKSYVVIDAFDRDSYIKIIPEENKIIGYTTRNSGGVPKNFKNYFVIVFDKPFTYNNAWSDKDIKEGVLELTDKHVGAAIGFSTKKGEKVTAKVASSFISFEQAELNLKELANKTFDDVKQSGKNRWNEVLGKIAVEGESTDQLKTFYSCLYRSVLFPRMFYEFDKQGNPQHYSPFNGEIRPGYMFTDTGFWDTFRCLFPFVNLVYPSMGEKMQAGLLNTYQESGFFPEWASPGHRGCMVGNNSASVVADAYLKGVTKSDALKMYEGLLSGANSVHPRVSSTGRLGFDLYNNKGYVPYDVKINESVARTLEYAYDDWCILQMGKKLNRPQAELDLYKSRSLNYKNVFDKETKLMRGRNADGQFQTPFNPFKWGDAFTEGNSWHYTWSVFHDVQGLVDLMGGKKTFVSMLDSVFSLPPVFDDSYYGGVIHEIREMEIMNMGNYAHGNQPIQHMIYLYNYAGTPYKAQYWLREVMNRLYMATPDGYCGDEDNGQTSAWYVFSAMGFYPVTPGSDQYVLGAPLFNKITLTLENGNKIEINAPNNNANNRYIDRVDYEGKEYTKNYLNHSLLMKGAKIDIKMVARPNMKRGIADDDMPYSLSNENKK